MKWCAQNRDNCGDHNQVVENQIRANSRFKANKFGGYVNK